MQCKCCGYPMNNGARFCVQCGAPAQDAALPGGIVRDGQGRVCWVFQTKDNLRRYFLDEEKVLEMLSPNVKQASKGKRAALGVLDFIDAFGPGDSMYAELPSEMLGGAPADMRIPSSYRLMKWIKGRKNRGQITVYAESYQRTLYLASPEQYDFVYQFLVSHCPNAKLK